MLGSRADADDMVQEAYLRWHRTPTDEIRSAEAWLVTAITRLSVDRLRQLRAERTVYVGPWLPEPLVAETAPPADQSSELASDLSVAFLAPLERLQPEERAAFLLHEVFDSGYSDIAAILGKSEAACRQIVSRAKKRVHAARPRVEVSVEARTELLSSFVRAIHDADEKALISLLAKDAAWTADGGGKTAASRKVIQGSERIARFVLGWSRRLVEQMELRPVLVNDEPGLAWISDGTLRAILSIRTDGVRILDVYSILNPDKLRSVKLRDAM